MARTVLGAAAGQMTGPVLVADLEAFWDRPARGCPISESLRPSRYPAENLTRARHLAPRRQ